MADMPNPVARYVFPCLRDHDQHSLREAHPSFAVAYDEAVGHCAIGYAASASDDVHAGLGTRSPWWPVPSTADCTRRAVCVSVASPNVCHLKQMNPLRLILLPPPEGTPQAPDFDIAEVLLGIEGLTAVDMSALTNVRAFPNQFFADCKCLQHVVWPATRSEVQDTMRSNGLVSTQIVTVPPALSSIGTCAFWHSNIDVLDLTSCPGITQLGDSFAQWCPRLVTVDLSTLGDLDTIPAFSFFRTPALRTVRFPPGLKRIDEHVLAHSGIEDVDLSTCPLLQCVASTFCDNCHKLRSIALHSCTKPQILPCGYDRMVYKRV